ncbi:hypothetical protein CVIRNUC_005445 [Coccomyxa viridis]|uniref:Rrn7/TAF1B C-terminal cyclin domain-containing protein n=1 Tax=Coccomyxa viridis TaxID=1274662 RepID=A0AAV1I5G3_9CHLO|nr:hypothetical protein CVIRNUC_005445 [Coccomyxa viridis]
MTESSEACPQCQGTSWTLSDGVLVCEICGTQSQVFVQEQQEFQTGIDDLRYRRRAGGPSRRPASAQASEHLPPDVDTVHAMLITYSKALQHALQAMMQALQGLCGSGAPLTSTIRQLWMAIISECGILTLKFARGVKVSMDEVLPMQRAWRITLKGAAWKVLHPDTLLAVLFLGCWVAREAVTGMDILQWANDGTLPFLCLGALSKRVLERLDAVSLGFPLPLLEPSGVMGIQDLMALSAQKAHQINVLLPPVNAPALILRLSQELAIPQEVARAALRLYEVHLAGAPQMRLQDDIHMHPYTHIAAIMLVAIKLLYCLDAEAPEDSDADAPASIDWQAWAEAVVKASRGPVSFPTSAAAASMMSAEQLEAYLQFLRSIVVVSRDSPSSLQDITEAACKRAWLSTTNSGGDPAAALTAEQIPMLLCPSGHDSSGRSYRLSSLRDPAGLYSMGTDYAAVTTALAAHLWLQPTYLHRAVISMESAMKGLECTVEDADDRLCAQVQA